MKHLSLYSILSFDIILLMEQSTRIDGRLLNNFQSIDRDTRSTRDFENLKKILNYIQNSSEFLPLTLSIVIPEFRSNTVDFLFECLANNSINIYVSRAKDPSSASWINEIHLTWILFVDGAESLDTFLQRRTNLWKSSNEYLIVLTNENTEIPWREILRNLWKMYSVYRVLIASIEDEFECLVKYLPFDLHEGEFGNIDRLCFRRYTRISLNGTWKNEENISYIDESTKLFDNFQDLHNYNLDVMVFESLMMEISYDKQNKKLVLQKVDAKVFEVLNSSMKVKFRVRSMRKKDYRGSDPFDLSLQAIEKGEVEMVVTGFFTKRYPKFKKHEFTVSAYEDKLCFLAPSSGNVPKYYMPFLPFEKDLWILLLVYNTVITFLWLGLKHLSKSFHDPRANTKIQSSILPSSATRRPRDRATPIAIPRERYPPNPEKSSAGSKIETEVENPISGKNHPPEIPPYVWGFFDFVETFWYPLEAADTAAQRALLFGTLFFGLIVNGLYQSYLVSSLSKPFHYPELTTIQDVIRSDKPVITKYSNLKRIFNTSVDEELYKKIRLVSNATSSTEEMVVIEKKIALARFGNVKLQNMSMYYDDEGYALFHIVEECPAYFLVSYVLRLNSPYADRINSILLTLQSAGLVKKLYEDRLRSIEELEIKKKAVRSERKIKLTLRHYSLTFFLLFVGLLLCVFVFAAELYYAKRIGIKD